MPFPQHHNSEDCANKSFSNHFNLDTVIHGPKHPWRKVGLWPFSYPVLTTSSLDRRTQPYRQFELLEWYKKDATMVMNLIKVQHKVSKPL